MPKQKRAKTPREQLFVDYYLSGFNGSHAARKAGYSKKTAAQIAYELLRKPQIQAEINRRLSEAAMSANEVLHRLAAQARADITDFVQLDSRGMPYFDFKAAKEAGVLHLIKKIIVDKLGEVRSVEFYDAQEALVQLGRHHKLFVDRVEIADWRKEVEEAGVNSAQLYEELVNSLAARLIAGAGSDVDGSDGGGEAES